MAANTPIVWKPDPHDRGIVHTIRVFGFGSALTHCDKRMAVETMKDEPPATWQTPCRGCLDARGS